MDARRKGCHEERQRVRRRRDHASESGCLVSSWRWGAPRAPGRATASRPHLPTATGQPLSAGPHAEVVLLRQSSSTTACPRDSMTRRSYSTLLIGLVLGSAIIATSIANVVADEGTADGGTAEGGDNTDITANDAPRDKMPALSLADALVRSRCSTFLYGRKLLLTLLFFRQSALLRNRERLRMFGSSLHERASLLSSCVYVCVTDAD